MDCLIGKQSDSQVILDMFFRKSHFVIIRLLKKQNQENVTEQINNIKKSCGIKLYSKVMRIGLTDNGTEFYGVIPIEYDEDTGKKITTYSFVIQVLLGKKLVLNIIIIIFAMFPKGVSIQNLTVEQAQRLEDTINNILEIH